MLVILTLCVALAGDCRAQTNEHLSGISAGTAASAAAKVSFDHSGATLGWGQVVKSLGAVIVVLGLLIGINLYIRRRAGQWKAASGRCIRIVEQTAFDARRRLVLVEVCGRKVLLAVAPQQVTALTEWPQKGEGDEGSAN